MDTGFFQCPIPTFPKKPRNISLIFRKLSHQKKIAVYTDINADAHFNTASLVVEKIDLQGNTNHPDQQAVNMKKIRDVDETNISLDDQRQ